MSAATATLCGALIAGMFTLFGVVAGALMVEDRLRRRGEVRFDVRAWVDGRTLTSREGECREFETRFFNDRDVNASLWNLDVEFYEGDEVISRMFPERPISIARAQRISVEPVELPSRMSVYQTMRLEARDQFPETVKRAGRARFVAVIVPGNERISAPLPPCTPWERTQPWPTHPSEKISQKSVCRILHSRGPIVVVEHRSQHHI